MWIVFDLFIVLTSMAHLLLLYKHSMSNGCVGSNGFVWAIHFVFWNCVFFEFIIIYCVAPSDSAVSIAICGVV